VEPPRNLEPLRVDPTDEAPTVPAEDALRDPAATSQASRDGDTDQEGGNR
jgi:hypothetical protein